MTTDATFRYRTFDWQASSGKLLEYRYIVAQQPDIGGETAKRDALSALEAALPRPVTGWSFLLIPSVSLVCGGKEEMRPLAALLTQAGHRCYVAEWPGWTGDAQMNWALSQCRLEDLSAEYQDFWCQLLEHISDTECQESRAQIDSEESSPGFQHEPRVCVVAAGSGAVYALRGIAALHGWADEVRNAGGDVGSSCFQGGTAALPLDSFVMLAPSWHTQREGLATRFSAPDASRHLGSWLHSDSRPGRLLRNLHFSKWRFRKHFPHKNVPEGSYAAETASWLFQRYRPYIQTDGAVLNGLIDPAGSPSAASLAAELASCSQRLRGGLLLLSPTSAPQSVALSAALKDEALAANIRVMPIDDASLLPHEVSPSSVYMAMEAWLAERRSGVAEQPVSR